MGNDRKPRDEEIDCYGMTHQGKVRKDNQDQFLIATLHRRLQILQTSLSDAGRVPKADVENAQTKGQVIGWVQGASAVVVAGLVLSAIGWLPALIVVGGLVFVAVKVFGK
jgi:hypothetical protein